MSPSRFLAVILIALLPALALANVPPAVRDAHQAMRNGQPAVALERINRHLANHPKDAQGRFLKGLILTELGRNPEAIRVFTELTEDHPELPEPYNNLAVLYAAQADYERAKQSLQMAIRTHPSYATAHENLGDIFAKMASQAYDRALQLDHTNVSAQTKLALIRDLFSPVARQPGAPAQAPAQAAAAAPAKARTAASKAAPAAPEGTPAATPAEAANPATATASADREAVLATVQAWANAWMAQDVAAYLAHYDAEFRVPGGRTRAEWEALRHERITRPAFIRLNLSQIRAELQGDTATVRFRQRFESNTFRGTDNKVLTLVNRNGAWKIVEEQ